MTVHYSPREFTSCFPLGLKDRTVAPDGSGLMTGFDITPGVTGVILIGAGCDATFTVPAASSSDNVEGLVGTG